MKRKHKWCWRGSYYTGADRTRPPSAVTEQCSRCGLVRRRSDSLYVPTAYYIPEILRQARAEGRDPCVVKGADE